jgi:hypothetical protein
MNGQPSVEKRAPKILEELERLDETINKLESATTGIIEHVGQVMTPRAATAEDKVRPPYNGSQIAGALNDYSDRVSRIISRIVDANESIEL